MENKSRTREILHVFQGVSIPIRIYFERRSNVRISMGQKNAILRIPSHLSVTESSKHLEWAGVWLDQQFSKNPTLLKRFIPKDYKDGDLIQINNEEFTLRLEVSQRKTMGGIIEGNQLFIKIPDSLEKDMWAPAIKKLLSRLFAAKYLPEVKERIRFLNDRFFQEEITSIKIKYNRSNWGSCSAKKNINISSRLLFAPKEVQDYVFIHELTHLKELNHSKRFWYIVGKIVPDYKQKEKWLRENSHLLDF